MVGCDMRAHHRGVSNVQSDGQASALVRLYPRAGRSRRGRRLS